MMMTMMTPREFSSFLVLSVRLLSSLCLLLSRLFSLFPQFSPRSFFFLKAILPPKNLALSLPCLRPPLFSMKEEKEEEDFCGTQESSPNRGRALRASLSFCARRVFLFPLSSLSSSSSPPVVASFSSLASALFFFCSSILLLLIASPLFFPGVPTPRTTLPSSFSSSSASRTSFSCSFLLFAEARVPLSGRSFPSAGETSRASSSSSSQAVRELVQGEDEEEKKSVMVSKEEEEEEEGSSSERNAPSNHSFDYAEEKRGRGVSLSPSLFRKEDVDAPDDPGGQGESYRRKKKSADGRSHAALLEVGEDGRAPQSHVKSEEEEGEEDEAASPVVFAIRRGRDLGSLKNPGGRQRGTRRRGMSKHNQHCPPSSSRSPCSPSPPHRGDGLKNQKSRGTLQKSRKREFFLFSFFPWLRNRTAKPREEEEAGGVEGRGRRKTLDVGLLLSAKLPGRRHEEQLGSDAPRATRGGVFLGGEDSSSDFRARRRRLVTHLLRTPHEDRRSGEKEKKKKRSLPRRFSGMGGEGEGWKKRAGDLAGYARQSTRGRSVVKSIVMSMVVALVTLRLIFSRKRKGTKGSEGESLSAEVIGGGGGVEEEAREGRRREEGFGREEGGQEEDVRGSRKRILTLTDSRRGPQSQVSVDSNASFSADALPGDSSNSPFERRRRFGRGFLRSSTDDDCERRKMQDPEQQRRQLESSERLKTRLDSLKKSQGGGRGGSAGSFASGLSSQATRSPKQLYKESKKIREEIDDLYALLQDLRKSNNELEKRLLNPDDSLAYYSGGGGGADWRGARSSSSSSAATGLLQSDTALPSTAASSPSSSNLMQNLGLSNLLNSLFPSSSSSAHGETPPSSIRANGSASGGGGGPSFLASSLGGGGGHGVHTPHVFTGGGGGGAGGLFASSSPSSSSPGDLLGASHETNSSKKIATERKIMEAESQKQKALAEKAMMKSRLEQTEAEVAMLLERLRVAEGKINEEQRASESLRSCNEALAQKVQMSKEALKNLKIDHEKLKQYARDLAAYSDYLQRDETAEHPRATPSETT